MRQLLIGLVKLTEPPDNAVLDGCKGAYVNALAKVENDEEFTNRVSKAATQIGLVLESIDWIETVKDRLEHFDFDDTLAELVNEAEREESVHFGVFHAWYE